MRRFAAMLVMILPLLPAPAEALTVQEVIDLTRAGLGDEVLLALIEVDDRVFSIDTETLTRLKKAGVSERVIAAMVRSGRVRPPEPAPVVPVDEPGEPAELNAAENRQQPRVVVIDHQQPIVREVVVPIAVPVFVDHRGRTRRHSGSAVVVNPAVPAAVTPLIGLGPIQPHPVKVKEPEPVYWGWGGKLRPDAWKPAKPQNQRQ